MLGEEKKGGEIVVSWTLWCFKFFVNSAAIISSDTLRFLLQFLIWYQRFVAAMVLLHTLVFWFIMLLLYAGFQCWKFCCLYPFFHSI